MFIRTTAINKLLKLNKFVKGVQGGSSAGKTYGIIPIEINYAIRNPSTETSIVAESIPHLKRGAIRDFKKIMKETNRWNESNWNASDFKYTFSNESFIEFFSADNSAKLRGARRDRLYINECNNIDFNSYTELAMRTKQSIFLDWNPTTEFWFHNEVIHDDDVDFIILTYKDNEAAPLKSVEFILKAEQKGKTSEYWRNWHRVYGLGEIGNLEGVVFSNYQLVDSIPEDAKLVGYGLDFGYSNDPTALVAIYLFNGQRYIDQILYRTGMMNGEIAKHIESGVICYADSAEPKSIEEIRRYGKTIRGVTKGKDSINYGIQVMQEQAYFITKRSTDLIKELRGYIWDKDKSGNTMNRPIGVDHALDAFRYHEMEAIGIKRNFGQYDVR